MRDLVRETTVSARDLVLPLFVVEGSGIRQPVPSMPGVYRLSIDRAIAVTGEARALGIPAVAVFPVIDAALKDPRGTLALRAEGLACRAARRLKDAFPDVGIIGDIALDPYTSHGHDGIVVSQDVENDETVELLAEMAVIHARAGFDIVAPSDMMDGRVHAIRAALDGAGLTEIAILAYAAKYASAFYGPFREAVGSVTEPGRLGSIDKRSYQMDPGNALEALREVALDLDEGADMVMVKPGMPCLDIVRRVRDRFSVPTFAYQVSGEYAMLRAAADAGWVSWEAVLLESLLSIKRAGADAIFTYAALDAAELLRESR